MFLFFTSLCGMENSENEADVSDLVLSVADTILSEDAIIFDKNKGIEKALSIVTRQDLSAVLKAQYRLVLYLDFHVFFDCENECSVSPFYSGEGAATKWFLFFTKNFQHIRDQRYLDRHLFSLGCFVWELLGMSYSSLLSPQDLCEFAEKNEPMWQLKNIKLDENYPFVATLSDFVNQKRIEKQDAFNSLNEGEGIASHEEFSKDPFDCFLRFCRIPKKITYVSSEKDLSCKI